MNCHIQASLKSTGKLFGSKLKKGVYEKTLPTSELTDLHAIKDDFLEYAKQDFDEANKKKTV